MVSKSQPGSTPALLPLLPDPQQLKSTAPMPGPWRIGTGVVERISSPTLGRGLDSRKHGFLRDQAEAKEAKITVLVKQSSLG
jgi:hypothetical protein